MFTLQTLPDCRPDNGLVDTVGKVAGFSLHAGVATRAHERDKLERLCRYIARPAVSTKRLSLTRYGKAHSVPFPVRFLFSSQPTVKGKVLGIVYRTIATHLIHKAGYTTAHAGAVTQIQCFGGALNAHILCEASHNE